MTMIDPAGAVSTKWEDSLGADVSDARTIWTVYAGAQIFISDPGEGESKWTPGMCPPWGIPSLINASDISQVENGVS
jgi:hypothetical protein